jgi:hypothetical protein
VLAFPVGSEVIDDHDHDQTVTTMLEQYTASNNRLHETVDDPRRGAVGIASLSASPRNAINQHSNSSYPTIHTSITTVPQEILLQYLRQAKRLMEKWVKLDRTTGVDSNPDPAPE